MSPAASGEGRLIEIALEVDDPATYVRYGGRLTDDNGSPVADVELRLLCAVDRPGMDEHDFIVWWKEGMSPGKQVTLEQLSDAQAGQLDLRADPPASVALHIDRQAFPDAAEIFVFRSYVEPIVQLHTNLRLDLNPTLNSFEISDLAAGVYQVQLRSAARPSRVLARRSFKLDRGEKLRVDLTAEHREADRRRKR